MYPWLEYTLNALAYICEVLGLSSIGAWIRARNEPLRIEDATKHVARLQVYGFTCYQCGKALVDGDEVTWLQWPSGDKTGMLHLACHEKAYAASPPDDHGCASDRQPDAV